MVHTTVLGPYKPQRPVQSFSPGVEASSVSTASVPGQILQSGLQRPQSWSRASVLGSRALRSLGVERSVPGSTTSLSPGSRGLSPGPKSLSPWCRGLILSTASFLAHLSPGLQPQFLVYSLSPGVTATVLGQEPQSWGLQLRSGPTASVPGSSSLSLVA
uniref:Uncharacterized protein n=1 Tax=Knipowitschia caucasica TaxID=637954 RepID=A0AAV2LX86_KNICA